MLGLCGLRDHPRHEYDLGEDHRYERWWSRRVGRQGKGLGGLIDPRGLGQNQCGKRQED